ncbi:uncharacterized protein LOC111913756 [Lactuca sativa]|uniref:uncharacterized protein LOC111913756 n=1 Tax=Lactuca sativa TaxID=4236 RepID=UPI000CD8D08E|nr:uncharacterized protein LOC111913756 [Lactuca sativa]
MVAMDTSNVHNLAVFTLFLVFHLVSSVPIPPFAPRPLCNFQLALANQACAYLPSWRLPPSPLSPPSPFPPVYPSSPPPPEYHRHRHRHVHSHMHEHGPDEQIHNQTRDHDRGHGHRRRHDHHHNHGHSHHRHRMSPVEQQCCKWLAQVDDECVCELLGRLPPFLARPVHEYTVRVAGSCNTTYTCGAQLRI